MTEAYIYDAIRTPRGRGKKDGSLHTVKPLDLVVGLIDEVKDRFPNMDTNRIDDVLLGVVTPVGDQGACIAKTAALAAGLPDTVAGYQLNRFCASGLEAVNTGAQKVASGWDDLILAGGVESMSRIPMGSDGGAWAMDPITNYETGFVPQGIGADLIATIEGWSRRDVDEFAAQSQSRAANAWEKGYFEKSVVPVKDLNGMTVLAQDEHVRAGTTADALAAATRTAPLRPAHRGWSAVATAGAFARESLAQLGGPTRAAGWLECAHGTDKAPGEPELSRPMARAAPTPSKGMCALHVCRCAVA